MRIAILTFHRAYNCGAMLQAWALKSALEGFGHSVEFPLCNHVGETLALSNLNVLHIPNGKKGLAWLRSLLGRICIDIAHLFLRHPCADRFNEFRTMYLTERKCRPIELGKFYDCIVIGGDQVWNPSLSAQWLPIFTGEAIPHSIPIVTYAVSGGDASIPPEVVDRLLPLLRRAEAVALREKGLCDKFEGKAKAQVFMSPDPVFLQDSKSYLSRLKIAKRQLSRPYVYMYTFGTPESVKRIATSIAKSLNCDLVISDGRHLSGNVRSDIHFDTGPIQFLDYIVNAKYVVTTSFHGTAFSVIFGKSFLSVSMCDDPSKSRIGNLLNSIGLGDRLVQSNYSIEHLARIIKTPLPTMLGEKLFAERESASKWLSDAINRSVEGWRQ